MNRMSGDRCPRWYGSIFERKEACQAKSGFLALATRPIFNGGINQSKEGEMSHRRITGILVLVLVAAFLLPSCGGGGGGGSSAPPGPTVVTGSASDTTNVSATLNGTVNPNGLDTDVWFEWGTDSGLANPDNTATQAFAAGTAVQPASAAISGLTYNTTYYFRIVASNSSGVVRGNTQNFSTSASRPTVTTLAATNLAATSATLNGEVNPNFLATDAWFEYSETDNTLATSTATTPVAIGSGSAVVATAANITGLTPGGTVYFRAAASNAVGEQKGSILTLSLANPPPVADAGPDNTAEMGQTVMLDGTGSTTPIGTITAYQWTQMAGTTVALADNNTATPSFVAPTVGVTGEVLRFQLEVTNSNNVTATDNVDITVTWVGFEESFSSPASIPGTYNPTDTQNPGGTMTYDAGRALISTGNDVGLAFSNPLPSSTSGVFQLDFAPITAYDSHGGIWVRLVQDANNYYEISNFDWSGFGATPALPDIAQIVKFVNGNPVDNVFLPVMGYTQGSTYNLSVTFTPTQVILQGFGAPVTLNTADNTAIAVTGFEIEVGQQDSHFDNLKLTAGP